MTYRRGIGTDTAVDHFEWTIPFVSILDPPSDPRILEGDLAQTLKSAAGSADTGDHIVSYVERVQRMERRARIPYHLTVEGLYARQQTDAYVTRRASFHFSVDYERLILTLGAVWALAASALFFLRAPSGQDP